MSLVILFLLHPRTQWTHGGVDVWWWNVRKLPAQWRAHYTHIRALSKFRQLLFFSTITFKVLIKHFIDGQNEDCLQLFEIQKSTISFKFVTSRHGNKKSADWSGVRAGPRDGLTRVHTAAVSIAVIVQRRRIFNLIWQLELDGAVCGTSISSPRARYFSIYLTRQKWWTYFAVCWHSQIFLQWAAELTSQASSLASYWSVEVTLQCKILQVVRGRRKFYNSQSGNLLPVNLQYADGRSTLNK